MLATIFLVFLNYAPYSKAVDILHARNSHVYAYSTNISIEGSTTAYKVINTAVHVTAYFLDSLEKNTFFTTGRKLLHIRLLPNGEKDETLEYEAISIHNDQGMVKVVHIPDKGIDMIKFNVLKGILSLFVINPNLESGYEIDSFGKCRVSYAIVDKDSISQAIWVIDKEKGGCDEVHRPIDTWNFDIFPKSDSGKAKSMLIRYHIRKGDGQLVKIDSHEVQYIPLVHGTSASTAKAISWQQLEFIEEIQRRKPKYLPDPNLSTMEKVISELSKSSTLKLHLAPSYPLELQSQSCSLNHHLTDPESFPTSKGSGSDQELISRLTQAVEAARDSLHGNQLGASQPAYVTLQLIQLMRCLPGGSLSVDVLAQATKLSPPAVQPELLYRQANSWRDQLSDVLVACGTPTCASVLAERLAALTSMAFPAVPVKERHEVEINRKMLFDRLWPSLSNLRQLDSVHVQRLVDSCERVPVRELRSVCDLSLVNIWSRAGRLDTNVTGYFTQLVKGYLLFKEDENNLDSQFGDRTNKSAAEMIEINDALTLVGLGMVDKMNIPEFLDVMQRMVENPPLISSSVYASVIRTATMLNEECNKGDSDQLERYRSTLIAILTANEDDFMIAQATLHGLLRLDATPLRLSGLLSKLASDGRWTLVRSVHLLAKELCHYDELPLVTCRCFGNTPMGSLDQGHCQLNMASGWSGLAFDSASKSVGKEQQIEGELYRMPDGSLIEHTTRFITGSTGELLYSNIKMSAQLGEWKVPMFKIETFTDNLESLNMLKKNTGKRRSARTGGWVSLRLKVFDTIHSPWRVFSGGYASAMHLLMSASSEPSSALKILQLPIDRREYSSFASGWILRLDTLGLVSTDLSGALETSILSRTGRSLVRISYSLTVEQHMLTYGDPSASIPSALFTNGAAVEGTVDFVSLLALSKMSSGICVIMNRGARTIARVWQQDKPNATYKLLDDDRPFQYRKIDAFSNSSQLQLLAASYNLGKTNSDICVDMKMQSIW